MPLTYLKLAQYDVSASAGVTNIEFTNISQSFDDLELKLSLRTTVADSEGKVTFNGTTTGYTIRRIWGNGASIGSDALYGYLMTNRSDYTASTFSNAFVYIPNYASSNNKTFFTDGVAETNGTNNTMVLSTSLWSNTAAITSIKLEPLSGNFALNSTATLYGIKRT